MQSEIRLEYINKFIEGKYKFKKNIEKEIYDVNFDQFEEKYKSYKLGLSNFCLNRCCQNYISTLIEKNKFKNYDIKYSDNPEEEFLIRLSLNELRDHIPNFQYTYKLDCDKLYCENMYNTIPLSKYLQSCCSEDVFSILLQFENAMNISNEYFNFHINCLNNFQIKKFNNKIKIPIYNFKRENYQKEYHETSILLYIIPDKDNITIENFKFGWYKKLKNYELNALESKNFLDLLCKYHTNDTKLKRIKCQFLRSITYGYEHRFFVNYLCSDKLPMIEELKPSLYFKNKILIIGCGSVARCTLPILIKKLGLKCSQITMIDFLDNRKYVEKFINDGLTFIQVKITPENYRCILNENLCSGDFLLDLAYNIETIDLIRWCNENNVLFCNTSVEEWDPYEDLSVKDPRLITLYHKQLELIESAKNNKSTAIVDVGCNPGMVNVIIKKGIVDIALVLCNKGILNKNKINKLIKENNYPELAKEIDLQVIHISERDTQLPKKPKKVNEFVGTWSVEGLREEATALAEMGFGTHEKYYPENAILHEYGPNNAICLSSMGMNTIVRSYIPGSNLNGFVIRHGESISMSRALTCYNENNEAIYRPSVYYAYCPCDATINSLHEFKMNAYQCNRENDRILFDEIIDGYDAVGCLMMGPKFGSWWIGSILDIHQTRQMIGRGHNPTVLQVAAHLTSCVLHCIKNPNCGLLFADDLDYKDILPECVDMFGDFLSEPVDWDPLVTDDDFLVFGKNKPSEEDKYQFNTFLIKLNTYQLDNDYMEMYYYNNQDE